MHQEESNWPLADGQTLKKKFDDIFAATKYTKVRHESAFEQYARLMPPVLSLPKLACMQALEALRKLRTEKMAEVKEFRLRLDHLRTHKDNAARLRRDVEEGETQERKLLDHIRAVEEQLNQLQQARAHSSPLVQLMQ